MAYNVIFTLTSAGLDSGPFNISGTTSSNVTVEIANNVSKSTLQAGYEVTISNDNITGGTVASTGVCTNTQPWVKPTGVTPTPTPPASICYTYTYDGQTPPNGVSVRYRDTTDTVVTILIASSNPNDPVLATMDNGDGTFTAAICVRQGGAYAIPTCVVGGLEQPCPDTWIEGGSCTTNGECFLN